MRKYDFLLRHLHNERLWRFGENGSSQRQLVRLRYVLIYMQITAETHEKKLFFPHCVEVNKTQSVFAQNKTCFASFLFGLNYDWAISATAALKTSQSDDCHESKTILEIRLAERGRFWG